MWGDGSPARPIASAAVMLLRDGPSGLEVLLIQRHERSDVLGGAHTFPGGKADLQDLDAVPWLDTPASALHAALGEPWLTGDEAAALHVAAIRETFEEAGVLLAAPPRAPAEAALGRAGDTPFTAVLSGAGIERLLASALAPWARWVTPVASRRARKHFDARFFVALAPADQDATHDRRESIACDWFTPRDALRAFAERRLQLAPPQLMTLLQLGAFHRADEVMTHARRHAPVHVQPTAVVQGDQELVCFPGDALHPATERAWSGPTRLVWRDGRFEFEDMAASAAF